ncbi:MAG: DUF1499 domain-containing protein [Roseivivax sp.]|nr:DUF1499 domain-containing protein [Roseivivax sp.]
MVLWLLALAVIGALAWIRLAPSDPARWNVDPMVAANQDLVNGVRRLVPDTGQTLAQLNAIALATPRTEVVGGSVEAGLITYVTRSLWFGFPDYTTLKADGGQIEVWGRQRFGRQDAGVNRARVDGWLAQLPDASGG